MAEEKYVYENHDQMGVIKSMNRRHYFGCGFAWILNLAFYMGSWWLELCKGGRYRYSSPIC